MVKAKHLALIRSLEEEALLANPLDENQVRQIDEYCGMLNAGGGEDQGITGTEPELASASMDPDDATYESDNYGYEFEESVLGALQSDSDGELSDVDEDA